MAKFVALMGEPATGKTTIFKALIERLQLTKNFEFGLLRGHFNPQTKCGVFGVYDEGTFQGTDRLSLAVMPDAIKFLGTQFCSEFNTIFFEGDRLCSEKFLGEVGKRYPLTCFRMIVDEATVQARHHARGDTQSAAWLKGRATKVNRVANLFGARPLHNQCQADLSSAVSALLLERGQISGISPT